MIADIIIMNCSNDIVFYCNSKTDMIYLLSDKNQAFVFL